MGLNLTTTVNSSIIIATSPIFTMFLSTKLFHQEELTPAKILGAFIAFLVYIWSLVVGRICLLVKVHCMVICSYF